MHHGRQPQKGVDLDLRFVRPWQGGDITFEGSASHLANYDRQYTATSPREVLVGQPNFPTAWRGRAAAYWTGRALTLGLSANFVDGGYDRARSAAIGSWTTFDGVVRLDLTNTPGLGGGVNLTLSAENLLNEDPPFYDSSRGIGYDAANANVLGRRVSLQLTKRW